MGGIESIPPWSQQCFYQSGSQTRTEPLRVVSTLTPFYSTTSEFVPNLSVEALILTLALTLTLTLTLTPTLIGQEFVPDPSDVPLMSILNHGVESIVLRAEMPVEGQLPNPP